MLTGYGEEMRVVQGKLLGKTFWSDIYPLLVVERTDGDLLLLAASRTPTVQTQIAWSLCTNLHWCDQPTVIG